MAIVRRVVEWVGNLFSGGLGLFLTGVGLVGKLSGTGNFQAGMLPWWTGEALINVLLCMGLLGLAAVALAASGKFRQLLPLWTFAVLVALVWGYLVSNFKYDGYDDFRTSIHLILAQFGAFGASVSQAMRKA